MKIGEIWKLINIKSMLYSDGPRGHLVKISSINNDYVQYIILEDLQRFGVLKREAFIRDYSKVYK